MRPCAALLALTLLALTHAAQPISEQRRKEDQLKQSSNRARMFIRFRKAAVQPDAQVLFRWRKGLTEDVNAKDGPFVICQLVPAGHESLAVLCQPPEEWQKKGMLELTNPHIRFGRAMGKPNFVRFGRPSDKPFLRFGKKQQDLAQVLRFGRATKDEIDARHTRNRPYFRIGK